MASALFAVLALTASGAGCGGGDAPAPEEPAAAPPAEAPAETPSAPEVHFDGLADGGTYPTEVEIVFTVDNFNIVPIENPLIARLGEGHYHLAVDVECAAAGEVIVEGNPSYIHFGTGNDRITMQFEPGDHRLCLQVANGEHRVIDGRDHSLLTKEIAITVE
jgi:hypothetical protein